MSNQGLFSLAPPVVLVVDDDPAVRSSLKFALEVEGYTVRTYPSAQALLRETDLPQNGCLVLDHLMPDISGLDLLALLRARAVALPAILITTDPSLALRQRATSAGAGVVEKPLLNNALLHAIQHAIAPSAGQTRDDSRFGTSE